jgi:hypothetical protein
MNGDTCLTRGVTCATRRRVIFLSHILALAMPMLTVSGGSLFDANWQASIRAGLAEGGDVREADIAADHRLPWNWSLGRRWSLETGLQAALGGIGDDEHSTAIGSLGPTLRLTTDRIPLSLVVGCSPTIIGRRRLGGEDLGSNFHFTSHAGLTWHITEHFEAGYRFQHMSNASLSSTNPGLNLHMAGLNWRF